MLEAIQEIAKVILGIVIIVFLGFFVWSTGFLQLIFKKIKSIFSKEE